MKPEHGTRSRYKSGCRCEPCTAAERDYARDYYRQYRRHTMRGHKPELAVAPIAAHVANLRRQGMSYCQIADAAGVTSYVVRALESPGRRGIQQRTAHALLGVTYQPPARQDATGARRRLQALACNGWSLALVADAAGVPHGTLSPIRSGSRPSATRAVIEATTKAYDALSMRHGPSKTAATMARRRGWPPPLAWDDDTIDDPNATPAGFLIPRPGKAGRPEVKRHHVEDIEYLLDAGCSPHEIAHRLDIQLDSVRTVLTRAGRHDLLARLRRTAA